MAAKAGGGAASEASTPALFPTKAPGPSPYPRYAGCGSDGSPVRDWCAATDVVDMTLGGASVVVHGRANEIKLNMSITLISLPSTTNNKFHYLSDQTTCD